MEEIAWVTAVRDTQKIQAGSVRFSFPSSCWHPACSAALEPQLLSPGAFFQPTQIIFLPMFLQFIFTQFPAQSPLAVLTFPICSRFDKIAQFQY